MEMVRSASWGQPPPVESQRGHLENGPHARGRQDSRNVDFSNVLQGFQRNGKVFMETVRSASWGQPPPAESQRGHLENIRFLKGFVKGAFVGSRARRPPARDWRRPLP